MRKIFLILFVLMVWFSSCTKESLPRGVEKLQTNHQLSEPGQIEVLELLWLGCPSCRAFHRNWVSLKKRFGDKVVFRSIPATFDNWIFDARVYVAMEELGLINDGLLANYFDVRQGPERSKFASDIQVVAQWLEQRYGTQEQDFLNMFHSSVVEDRLRAIRELIGKYPVTSVPSILVSVPDDQASYLVINAQADAAEKAISQLIQRALPK